MQTIRDITVFAGALSSGLLFLPQGGLRAAGPVKAKEKPNIVFILADDLGYGDVGFQGQQRFKTPNIDRLAREGVLFTRACVCNSLCAPCRATLLTGKYSHMNGKVDNRAAYDWNQAIAAGMKASGLPYSGEYGFTRTEMYWPLSHMVTPKERALGCADCHGAAGRMDWKALGYAGDPMLVGGRP